MAGANQALESSLRDCFRRRRRYMYVLLLVLFFLLLSRVLFHPKPLEFSILQHPKKTQDVLKARKTSEHRDHECEYPLFTVFLSA